MKVTIEEYRGFEIYFDTDHEVFQCVVADESAKESKSFSAVRKFVDEYKKENQDFNPFWVEANPSERFYEGRKPPIKIVGIRKDGRFVAEEKGKNVQVSDYDLRRYVVCEKDNDRYFILIEELMAKEKRQEEENKEHKAKILAGMKLTTLYDYKKTLLS